MLPDVLHILLSSFQLINPLLSDPLQLPAKLILLKPNDQLSNLPIIYLLYHLRKHQLNDLSLIFYAFKHPVKLLCKCLEHRCFLIESLSELVNHAGHLGKIQVQYLHDLEINGLRGVVEQVSFVESYASEEVFMDVTNELLDYFVHVVVHDCHPLAARCAEALKHELDLVLYQLVWTLGVLNDRLEVFVCLCLAF